MGVNFIGGYSALVQKGFSDGDYALIESIPEALSITDHVCASVNIGSTKAGINMDAVRMMGGVVKRLPSLQPTVTVLVRLSWLFSAMPLRIIHLWQVHCMVQVSLTAKLT